MLFVVLLLAPHCLATADELRRAQSALADLRTSLQSGRIVRAHIFFLPYTILTPTAVTPELLEISAKYKFDVELNAELVGGLIQAIDSTKLHLDNETSDLRWGAAFFDKSGLRVHSIYLSGWHGSFEPGRKGSIGGVDVELNRSLVVWFEINFDTR